MKDLLHKFAMETVIFQQFLNSFQFGCTRCSLSNHGCHPVIYRGNPKADIMLLGESPGLQEEKEGKPFCGPAGKLLDKIFNAISLDTNTDMFLTNCTFCRPTAPKNSSKQNYTPKKEQLSICWPFVEREIELLKPKVIIACGRTALSQLTGDSNIRMYQYEGKWISYKDIPVFVMVHPASILYKEPWPDAQREMKIKVWKYMQQFRDTWKKKL